MIHYVVASNPDDRVFHRAAKILSEGGVISFPTDTSWVLGVSPNSKTSVEKLYKIKHAVNKKHFSVVCNSISQASKYAFISDFAYKKINRVLPGHYTFIFEPTRDLPRAIKQYRKEKQIGIRIPDSMICSGLVETCGHPIVTTSITKNVLEEHLDGKQDIGFTDEIYSYQIEYVFQNIIDMIIDPGEYEIFGVSSVVDFSSNDDIPVVIREGSGELSLFC
ncbi:MAG: threonylcarbamoyl-AMP synthase [Bacteriovoracaceae bacterium]|nr:threonylcarbamoyl-AMP synthase [Bacteriovoracaceae bacterium]